MKNIPSFGFIDEPQFRTQMSRTECANKLKAYRCKENGNFTRYTIKRINQGFMVKLNYTGSPVALIITRG